MSVGAVNKQTGERIQTAGMPAVDSVLSGSSTNPVQNRVVKAALGERADTDMVAADFNAGTSYTAGNYCVQDGKLYKFKNNHSGAWSAADVDEVKIAGELSALKSGLTEVNSKLNGLHFAQITRTTDQYGQLPVDNDILSKMVGAFVMYDPNVDGNMFAVYANTGTLRIYAMNNASHTADTAHFVQEKTVVVNILYYDFS